MRFAENLKRQSSESNIAKEMANLLPCNLTTIGFFHAFEIGKNYLFIISTINLIANRSCFYVQTA